MEFLVAQECKCSAKRLQGWAKRNENIQTPGWAKICGFVVLPTISFSSLSFESLVEVKFDFPNKTSLKDQQCA